MWDITAFDLRTLAPNRHISLRSVVSHVSRKTSEIWGRNLLRLKPSGGADAGAWRRGVDFDPLHYAVDDPLRARIVWIQTNAQAQVVSQQLRNQDLKGCAQVVRRVGQHGRDHVVKAAPILVRASDHDRVADPLGTELTDEIQLVEPAG